MEYRGCFKVLHRNKEMLRVLWGIGGVSKYCTKTKKCPGFCGVLWASESTAQKLKKHPGFCGMFLLGVVGLLLFKDCELTYSSWGNTQPTLTLSRSTVQKQRNVQGLWDVLAGCSGCASEFEITCCGTVCTGEFLCSFKCMGGLTVREVRRARIPLLWSTVRERACSRPTDLWAKPRWTHEDEGNKTR